MHGKDDSITISSVKLCYRKNRSPIGCGRFGIVTAGQILSITSKEGETVQTRTSEVAVKTILMRQTSIKVSFIFIIDID